MPTVLAATSVGGRAGRSILLAIALVAAGCEAPADPPASPPRAAQLLAPPPDTNVGDGGHVDAADGGGEADEIGRASCRERVFLRV